MPDMIKFDLDYRPASYWVKRIGSTIKGELRRRYALDSLDRKIASTAILNESLTEEERAAATSFHPSMMRGEYLPDLLPDEVEIARVVMKSTMMDVISIRARKTKRRILYRIVTEYEDTPYQEYVVRPQTSSQPLTLRELISMMDGAVENGLVGNGRQGNYEDGGMAAEDVYDFDAASSLFYPQHAGWYDATNDEWLAKIQNERLAEEAEFERKREHSPAAKTPLQLCIDGAKWVVEGWRGASGIPHAFNMSLRREAARFYAKQYLHTHKRLPEGPHQVVVSYGPTGTADIVPPVFYDNIGTFNVEITFTIIGTEK